MNLAQNLMKIGKVRSSLSKILLLIFVTLGCTNLHLPFTGTAAENNDHEVDWIHLTSKNGDLAPPSQSTQQTASLILDIDKDGIDDFVIGARQAPGPSLVWYRRGEQGWDRYVIDHTVLDIEAGGAYHDIDGDGDLDIVMGGDYLSNKVWWWENPYPSFDPDTPWARWEIKNSGDNKHHDQMFGDFDGDGKAELVFWNQSARSLFIADVPDNPKGTQPWSYSSIYSWSEGSEHEGLARADIDGDGQVDLIGGGRWFKHQNGKYTPEVIDDGQRFSRVAVGQLKEGGRPEVVFVVGDGVGRLVWYEWDGSGWIGTDFLNHDIDHGHSLDVADVNGDGHLDIFTAEMRLDGGNSDANIWVFEGDGQGNFATKVIATGYGNHESRLGDLDGDGDLDILGKPYNWDTPRVDIWLNNPSTFPDQWKRQVIDDNRPWQAVFIDAGDMNGDGRYDIVTGGWWYQNPGESGFPWERKTIGSPLHNMAAIYDFDGDGDLDILGTSGQGSDPNSTFVWARNDGKGEFTILNNIAPGEGDFLQGVAVGRFQDGKLGVALSWHEGNRGIQMLTLPSDPSSQEWAWSRISSTSQDEALSAGDIDRDGDLDILMGTQWLRNDGSGQWTAIPLFAENGLPDRNRLADINQDGRLDAVVGYEAISSQGKLAWYEQRTSPDETWNEHLIADPAIIGPMSLDVADMDGDGDFDVVAGEHNTDRPEQAVLYAFENVDGSGKEWKRHVIYTGDEHHDGARLVDIDGDGDLDILSIGWTHNQVLLYENQSGIKPDGPDSTPTEPVPTPGPIVTQQNETLLPIVPHHQENLPPGEASGSGEVLPESGEPAEPAENKIDLEDVISSQQPSKSSNSGIASLLIGLSIIAAAAAAVILGMVGIVIGLKAAKGVNSQNRN